MPWTLAHPAAVIPLHHFFRRCLVLIPLMIGSITPDLGYYIQQFGLATFAHGFQGSILVCLPSGALLLGILCLIRKPIGFMLPQPHRTIFSQSIEVSIPRHLTSILKTIISIWLGAWTHIAWDSFTHASGWAVTRIPFLHQELVNIGTIHLPAYYLLQQISTISGALILAILYRAALRRIPRTSVPPVQNRLRYAICGIIGFIALLIAIPLAIPASAAAQGYFALRVFLFKTAIFGTTAYISLLVVCSLLFYALRKTD
jgi:hypothetical protein